MLQGSIGDPGPVGYSGMKVECKSWLNISDILYTGAPRLKVTIETF